MGEPAGSSMPNKLPTWFLRYVQEQHNQSAIAQENERSRVVDQEREAKAARSRLVYNNNKPGKALLLLLEYYRDTNKLEA